MRQFSEALLLVAFTLLPSLFVNGLQELTPTINFKPTKRNAAIRGLLVVRQGVCVPGFLQCEVTGCCPIAWNCCIDSNCCDVGTYCALASNGIIGCCPDGETCSGPVGGPTTINGPPPPTLPPPPPPAPTPTVPAPTPTFNSVPAPSPTFNSVPPVTQTTVGPGPVVPTTASPTFKTPVPSTIPTTTGLVLNAAGQAQLYQPLLVLVGILVAVMC